MFLTLFLLKITILVLRGYKIQTKTTTVLPLCLFIWFSFLFFFFFLFLLLFVFLFFCFFAEEVNFNKKKYSILSLKPSIVDIQFEIGYNLKKKDCLLHINYFYQKISSHPLSKFILPTVKARQNSAVYSLGTSSL